MRLSLPIDVEADQAEAVLEHGVLTVRLPKAQESQARSIPVRTSQPIVAQSQPASTAGEPGMYAEQVAPEQTAMAQGAQVRPGLTVQGADGLSIGHITQVDPHGNSFELERPGGTEYAITVPFSAIQAVSGNAVILTVPANQIDQQDWMEIGSTGAGT